MIEKAINQNSNLWLCYHSLTVLLRN